MTILTMEKYFALIFLMLAAVNAAIPQHNLERKNNNNKGRKEWNDRRYSLCSENVSVRLQLNGCQKKEDNILHRAFFLHFFLLLRSSRGCCCCCSWCCVPFQKQTTHNDFLFRSTAINQYDGEVFLCWERERRAKIVRSIMPFDSNFKFGFENKHKTFSSPDPFFDGNIKPFLCCVKLLCKPSSQVFVSCALSPLCLSLKVFFSLSLALLLLLHEKLMKISAFSKRLDMRKRVKRSKKHWTS